MVAARVAATQYAQNIATEQSNGTVTMDGTVTFYDGGTFLGTGALTDDGFGDGIGTATSPVR